MLSHQAKVPDSLLCVTFGVVMTIGELGGRASGNILSYLPLFLRAPVVTGAKRGGKELGIPTANYPQDVVDNLPATFDTGIYYGWARVNQGTVYKMVMSVGWNPFYKNQKKSMETHILHSFNEDFYGEELSTVVLGYLRPEKNYPSLDALIEDIHQDIKNAQELLEKTENRSFVTHAFFTDRQTDSTQ